MSVQHTPLTYSPLTHSPRTHNSAGLPRETTTGQGGGALTRAVERWRRALLHDHAQGAPHLAPASPTPGPGAANPAPNLSGDLDGLATLARRLDDSGCSYGRVSAARLDSVVRAYDRLETKMNAVLMAVTGTFLSTLAGLLLYYVRGGGQ